MISKEEAAGLPVAAEVDVLVCGGGPAGVAAAIAAARLGAKTMLLEQFNCLGGVATAGGHGHICLYSAWGDGNRVVGGVIYELAQRCAALGYGVVNASSADFEVEGMKLALDQMAAEADVDVLYHSFVLDAAVDNSRVTDITVASKDGLRRVRAQRIVDCTGDGDVAARAGAPFDLGDAETGLCQPMTLMFTIGGVDYERVKQFRKGDYKLEAVWARAQAAGDMRPFQHQVMGWWWTPTRPDHLGINFTHINRVSALSARDLTAATMEGRRQAFESIAVYRKYIPGMEQCYMVSTPNTIGIRESRRVRGEYTLTRDDVMSGCRFADSIGYGSFFIDIHNTLGPGMDTKTWRPERGFKYQIPYRILLPVGLDNLLTAGRCVSCDHEALGSLRVMPQCGVMGQAAGTAAALSLQDNLLPRRLPLPRLQAVLRQAGQIVFDEDIVPALEPAAVRA